MELFKDRATSVVEAFNLHVRSQFGCLRLFVCVVAQAHIMRGSVVALFRGSYMPKTVSLRLHQHRVSVCRCYCYSPDVLRLVWYHTRATVVD